MNNAIMETPQDAPIVKYKQIIYVLRILQYSLYVFILFVGIKQFSLESNVILMLGVDVKIVRSRQGINLQELLLLIVIGRVVEIVSFNLGKLVMMGDMPMVMDVTLNVVFNLDGLAVVLQVKYLHVHNKYVEIRLSKEHKFVTMETQ